jgi:hypothetical protein
MKRWKNPDENARRDWATAMVPNVTIDRDNHAIQVTGPCARCGCSFEAVLTDSDLLNEAMKGLAPSDPDWAGTLTFNGFCYCTGEHPGRPEQITHGCGAWGRFEDDAE